MLGNPAESERERGREGEREGGREGGRERGGGGGEGERGGRKGEVVCVWHAGMYLCVCVGIYVYNTNTQPCRLICAPTKNLPLAVSSSPTILYNILSVYVGVSLSYMYMHCLGCAVLLCLVCLFDLACFFLSSFSSLISHLKTCI